MKNIFSKILMIVVFAFVLVACAPQVHTFVVMPEPLKVAVTAAITFAVGWVFTQIAVRIPWLTFLGQYVSEVSIAVAGAVVLYIQNLLNAIPAQYDDIVSLALQMLIAVFASIGLFKLLSKANVRGFR